MKIEEIDSKLAKTERVLNGDAEYDGADAARIIRDLCNALKDIKARNVINAIEKICPDCGHFLDDEGECANCWKTNAEQLHAEFGHVYSACRTFIKDWRDGDFKLPRLAEIHAEKIEEICLASDADHNGATPYEGVPMPPHS